MINFVAHYKQILTNINDMRKIAMTLLLLCVMIVTKAQIETRGYWYNGSMNYNATLQSGGKVIMNAMAEGEEMEFMLVPVAGKSGEYRVVDSPNDYVNEYFYITSVRHLKKEGWDVLCLYDDKHELKAVLQHVDEANSEVISLSKWKNQLMGEYSDGNDLFVDINWDQMDFNGEQTSYRIHTFNGQITPYITITGNANRLQGTWEIVLTLEGITLYSVTYDNEDSRWTRDEQTIVSLKKNNSRVSRFFYANNTLLNDKQFRRFSKSTLRFMRNSILAWHGYKFQSADLQQYFANESWYEPAANNKDVKPSFVEQLNIELIKGEESRSFEEY